MAKTRSRGPASPVKEGASKPTIKANTKAEVIKTVAKAKVKMAKNVKAKTTKVAKITPKKKAKAPTAKKVTSRPANVNSKTYDDAPRAPKGHTTYRLDYDPVTTVITRRYDSPAKEGYINILNGLDQLINVLAEELFSDIIAAEKKKWLENPCTTPWYQHKDHAVFRGRGLAMGLIQDRLQQYLDQDQKLFEEFHKAHENCVDKKVRDQKLKEQKPVPVKYSSRLGGLNKQD